MLDKFLKSIFGSKNDRVLKDLEPLVNEINTAYETIRELSDNNLRGKTAEFKAQIAEAIKEETDGIADIKARIDTVENVEEKEALYARIDELEKSSLEKTDELLQKILPEAFAVIKATAERFTDKEKLEVKATELDKELAPTTDAIDIDGDRAIFHTTWTAAGSKIKWQMVHYDVQLMGGMVLHRGSIAEMMTGEGKTLVATLPVYLNALSGRGVHLVTVNDYLARRDAEWMAPIFQFHGLTIDCIDKHRPNSAERRKAYACDVTYGTNNEFGFDYLRDNMAKNPEDLVQREHNYAIVDEVDSVLIDEARTPLIISGPTAQEDRQEFNELKPHVRKLVDAQKALVNKELKDAKDLIAQGDRKPTDEGAKKLLRAHRGLPKSKALIKFLSQDGMKTLLQKTENFYMQEQSKNMHLIDDDLFFTIDEKHNQIDLTGKGIDLISGDTDPDFYVLPDISTKIGELDRSGLEGIEKAEKKEEIMRDFSVKSERIHTMNQLLKAYSLFEKDVEYVVMDSKVKIVDEQTGRIMDGRRYSDGLHQAIEAKENVKIEASTQTFATVTLQNYFRMYNKLSGMTGTAETEAGEFWDIYELEVDVIPTNRPIARDDREDMVYKTKREKFAAVIEEIVNLVNDGRPVLVGTTSVEISELLSRQLRMRKIRHNVLNAKLHQKEAEIVAEAGTPGAVTIATNMAGRGTDIKLSDEAKEAGGLAIVGTERHDSRRVDRQLRGRAGRQGDPGSSQFYVSLEDDLMRLFNSERVAKLMDRMGLKEGEVIQHGMVSKSIERAQKKVEENAFGVRKRLLEFDDVMNSQREVIYKRRRHALYGERMQVDIANMFFDTCQSIVDEYQDARDYDGFQLELARVFTIEPPVSDEQFNKMNRQELVDTLNEKVLELYSEKNKRIAKMALPVIKDVFEKQGEKFKNIVIPITDGQKAIQVVTNLEKANTSEGRQLIRDLEKSVVLAMIDDAWRDHLRDMDDLRQNVSNAQYEQKDPLLIYKFEAFELFKQMIDKSNKEMVSFLFKGQLPTQDPNQVQQAKAPERTNYDQMQTQKQEVLSGGSSSGAHQDAGQPQHSPQSRPKPQPVIKGKSFGRNDVVKVQNMATGEKKEMKYKKAQPLVQSNQWMIVE